MRVSQTTCPDCGGKAGIYSASRDGSGQTAIQYICRNNTCGARFICNQTYGRIMRDNTPEQITRLPRNAITPASFNKTHGTCCPCCGQKAKILKTAPVHSQIAVLYYRCLGVSCGTRFTCDLTYSHHLNPGINSMASAVQVILNAMTPEQRAEIQKSTGISL